MQRIILNFLLVLLTGVLFAQEEPYRGGSADGHAFDRSETAFSFSPSFQPFQGGNGDGYSFVSQETPFGAAISFQPFRGDAGDGYKTDSLILFNPRAYITMYYPFAGSLGDGATNSPILGIFIPLPLKLLEFKGEQEREKNILLWTTANEEQTASFIIQRSADAMQYKDQDGKFTYSSVILLKRYGTGSTLTVFPNPTTQSVQIMMSRASANETITAQLVDMSGKVLQQKQIVHNSTIRFDLDAYVPGIYLIRVQVNGEQSVWRVIKQ